VRCAWRFWGVRGVWWRFPWKIPTTMVPRDTRKAQGVRRAQKTPAGAAGLDRSPPRAILGLAVQGVRHSYADGVEIRFNPFMNCIVGASGKSTVLRLVAYAFGMLRFFPGSRQQWLPQQVRVFVRDKTGVWCIQREGRHYDPNAPSVATSIQRLSGNGVWIEKCCGDAAREEARNAIEIWPNRSTLAQRSLPRHFADDDLDRLVERLDIARVRKRKPLLVHQPREIFHSADLFERVLRRPVLKFRQIIWATVSPNVPTALDAEKLIVTDVKKNTDPRRMEVVCGGDLHEDEVIRDFWIAWRAATRGSQEGKYCTRRNDTDQSVIFKIKNRMVRLYGLFLSGFLSGDRYAFICRYLPIPARSSVDENHTHIHGFGLPDRTGAEKYRFHDRKSFKACGRIRRSPFIS
jgi:hypothetical protein